MIGDHVCSGPSPAIIIPPVAPAPAASPEVDSRNSLELDSQPISAAPQPPGSPSRSLDASYQPDNTSSKLSLIKSGRLPPPKVDTSGASTLRLFQSPRIC